MLITVFLSYIVQLLWIDKSYTSVKGNTFTLNSEVLQGTQKGELVSFNVTGVIISFMQFI